VGAPSPTPHASTMDSGGIRLKAVSSSQMTFCDGSVTSITAAEAQGVWPLTELSFFATGSFSNRRTSHPPPSTYGSPR
jgi:hypothetical protein